MFLENVGASDSRAKLHLLVEGIHKQNTWFPKAK
jgi:hypothetical protein